MALGQEGGAALSPGHGGPEPQTPIPKEPNVQKTSQADKSRRPNRLIHATSPYLLQHAYNPVDWHEWGPEAFKKALEENKPIFLSIGYAACHWCHVMEHESFENQELADLLNEHFVSIKVDREERPDVDAIYMEITQAFNQGHGGWPMSVFLDPQRRPFYAGTYFPPDHFKALLSRIAEVWETKQDALQEDMGKAQAYLTAWARGPAPSETGLTSEILEKVADMLAGAFDRKLGGYRSEGNKFPPSMSMELFLRVHRRTKKPTLLEAVEVTLDRMARGGIYDHLGGGICRYSTDPQWLVPHFEKMLYDQALVSRIYLDAYQVTGKETYRKTAEDIFRYVLSDMTSPEGGFYSTLDADSEGMEGAYYIWTREEVLKILGEDEGRLFCDYYDVSESGNWFDRTGHAPPGPKNILQITKTPEVFTKMHDLTPDALAARVVRWREPMLAARRQRTPPSLDDKILTAWNGLMISSLARAGAILDQPRYTEAAASAADFILAHLQKDGRLLRTYRTGSARLGAYLSDYAFLIDGLLNLYEATFDLKWLEQAEALNRVVLAHYQDKERGGFFFTADDAEALIVRAKNPRDAAIPAGNSVQALNLLRLDVYLDRKPYREAAEATFQAFAPMVLESPSSFEKLLCAADFALDPGYEVVIAGRRDDAATRGMIRVAFEGYRPNQVTAWVPGEGINREWPLFMGKRALEGKAAAFVCRRYACQKPTQDAESLRRLLGA